LLTLLTSAFDTSRAEKADLKKEKVLTTHLFIQFSFLPPKDSVWDTLLHFCFTFPFSCGRTDTLGRNKQERPDLPLVLTPAVPWSQKSHKSCPMSAQQAFRKKQQPEAQ